MSVRLQTTYTVIIRTVHRCRRGRSCCHYSEYLKEHRMSPNPIQTPLNLSRYWFSLDIIPGMILSMISSIKNAANAARATIARNNR